MSFVAMPGYGETFDRAAAVLVPLDIIRICFLILSCLARCCSLSYTYNI